LGGYHFLCVLKPNPLQILDRNNGGLVWNGDASGFNFFKLDFDAFILAILSGYSTLFTYWSVKVLSHIDVLSFMVLVAGIHSIFSYNMHCYGKLFGLFWYGLDGFIYQTVVCQLMAWLSISYATQHITQFPKTSDKLLTPYWPGYFGWKITLNMIIGGIILLLGIRTTFYTKDTFSQNIFKSNSQFVIGNTKKKYENLKVIASMQMTRCL
jgi:hypothetical protein